MWSARDFTGLKAEVHKLHGACCYTGLPRLQELVSELESALKRELVEEVQSLIPELIKESEKVLSENNGTH